MAYQGGLGKPLIAPPGAVSRVTPDDLAEFVAEHFTGSNMALAGEGSSLCNGETMSGYQGV